MFNKILIAIVTILAALLSPMSVQAQTPCAPGSHDQSSCTTNQEAQKCLVNGGYDCESLTNLINPVTGGEVQAVNRDVNGAHPAADEFLSDAGVSKLFYGLLALLALVIVFLATHLIRGRRG